MTLELIPPAQLDVVEFRVFGDPKPGGSKKGFVDPRFDRVVVVEDSKNKPWKRAVTKAGLEAVGGTVPLFEDGALGVEFTFTRARPRSHFRTNGQVRDAVAGELPVTRPDVLKLARAVEDALTGVLWRDDSQIVDETLHKRWGEPGVAVRAWRLG